MPRSLLDTHVLLWWLAEPSRLAARAREAISRGSNAVSVSAVVAWEIGIERALGRLDVPCNLCEVLGRDRIEVLPIGLDHALALADLPMHHHAPVDRMPVARARLEDIVLITRGAAIKEYDVQVLDA